MHAVRTVDVPRPTGGGLGVSSRRKRRHALEFLLAFKVLGEPCIYQFVMDDGSPVPLDQITEEEAAEVASDVEYLGRKDPPTLDGLLEQLYAASAHSDRSRVAPALDCVLAYVDHWSALSPERIAVLFDRLEPARLVRAVGQTLLAATRLDGRHSTSRQAFFLRFLDDLRARGTPEPTIRRLAEGLQT